MQFGWEADVPTWPKMKWSDSMEGNPHLYYNESKLEDATESEKFFLEVMKQKLGPDWFVFHSVSFRAKGRNGIYYDREIDFLLFNPLRGFLVIEVKGGKIACRNGKYTVDGRPCEPFGQARGNMYDFHRQLMNKLNTNSVPFRMAYAVAFPFARADNLDLPLSDKSALIDARLLNKDVEKWMVSYIHDNATIHAAAEATSTVDDILHVLAPTTESEDAVGAAVDFETAEIERHSINPRQFLSLFAAFPRLKVCGCAGSGKTLLATEKARQLADCGKRTLFLCYNKLIAAKIAKNFTPSMPVTVAAFYDFGIDVLGLSRKQVARHEKDARAYRIIAQFLKDHIAEGKIRPYDAIIVDEAQDFTDEMWGIVSQLLADDSTFYVFYDPEQNIFGTSMNLPDFGMPPVMLTVNCRNTRKITEELRKYSSHAIEPAAGMPEGRAVKTLEGDCRENLGLLLDKLINHQKVKRESITILGAHNLDHTSIGADPVVNGFRIVEGSFGGAISYYTYMKFKGCDNKVIILLDVDGHDKRWGNAGIYTALSRATSQAYILRKPDTVNR